MATIRIREKLFSGVLLVATVCAGVSPAVVAGDDAAETAEPTKLEKALEKYDRTGEMKRCISPSQIRHMKVVDDNHILVEISSRKAYLSKLSHRCPSLGFHEAIVYEVRGGTLCGNDTFRVLDNTIVPGPVCGFGDFEKLTRKEKGSDAETDAGE